MFRIFSLLFFIWFLIVPGCSDQENYDHTPSIDIPHRDLSDQAQDDDGQETLIDTRDEVKDLQETQEDPCQYKPICNVLGTYCRDQSVIQCAEDQEGCWVESLVQNCEAPTQCIENQEGAACIDPCAEISPSCEIQGQTRCQGSVLEICSPHPSLSQCLMWKSYQDCSQVFGANTCKEDQGSAACTFDPCPQTSTCSVQEDSCSGTVLNRCQPNAFGCLVLEQFDCDPEGLGNTCDAFEEQPCQTQEPMDCSSFDLCELPGQRECHGNVLWTCEYNPFGCLAWKKDDCIEEAGSATGYCDATGLPQCRIDLQDRCSGKNTCYPQSWECQGDGLTLHQCDYDSVGCLVESLISCPDLHPNEICKVSNGLAQCGPPCEDQCNASDYPQCNRDIYLDCVIGDQGCYVLQTQACEGQICQVAPPSGCRENGSGQSCTDPLWVQRSLVLEGEDFIADATDQQQFAQCTVANGPEMVFAVALEQGDQLRFWESGGLDAVLHLMESCQNSASCLISEDLGFDESTGLIFDSDREQVVYAIVESATENPYFRDYDIHIQIVPQEGICGDGFVQSGTEACDDGNELDGDGCTECEIDYGYVCEGEPSQCTPIPTGNDCSWATEIAQSGRFSFSNSEMTNSYETYACDASWSAPGQDSTFKLSLDPHKVLKVSIPQSEFEAALVLHTGCDSNGVFSGCQASLQNAVGQGPLSYENLSDQVQDVYFTVDPLNAEDVGNFDLEVEIYTPECGNGIVDREESCDDGNDTEDDGCTQCEIDDGYWCVGMPSQCQVHEPGDLCETATLVESGDYQLNLNLYGNDYEVYGGACQDISAPGRDLLYQVVVPPNQLLKISVSNAMFEPRLFLSASCDPDLGTQCMAYALNGASLHYFNASNEEGHYILVIESQDPLAGGTFDLHIEISAPVCGNGIIEGNEQCEDGNQVDGDGCSASCTLEHSGDLCSEAIELSLEPNREIVIGQQDFSANFSDQIELDNGCLGTSNASEIVFKVYAEEGDIYHFEERGGIDFNFNISESCNATMECSWSSDLGSDESGGFDHVAQSTGEFYFIAESKGSEALPYEFYISMHRSICGDGVIEGLETCDDGNQNAWDGCSNFCQTESGYVCTNEPSFCYEEGAGDSCAHPVQIYEPRLLDLSTESMSSTIEEYSSCTSDVLSGPEFIFEIQVDTGHLLYATLSEASFEGALVLVRDCTDATNTCIAYDRQVSNEEHIEWTNTEGDPVTVYLIVEGRTSTDYGDFRLNLSF